MRKPNHKLTDFNKLSGEYRRKKRKEIILDLVKQISYKKKECADESSLIAQLSLDWGLKIKTIKEYIEELIFANVIERIYDKDKSWLKSK